jgi:hypothetical protein
VVGVGFMGELVWMGIGGIVSCEGCGGLVWWVVLRWC